MSRRCMLTDKGVMSGNNVSHAINKTRRKFLPNLQATRLHSDILGEDIQMRITTAALRTIDKKGGLDAFLTTTANRRLPDDAVRLKKRILNKKAS